MSDNLDSTTPRKKRTLRTLQLLGLGGWLILAIVVNHWIGWTLYALLVLSALFPPKPKRERRPATRTVHVRVQTGPGKKWSRREVQRTLEASLKHHELSSWWTETYTEEDQQAILARLLETLQGATPTGRFHSSAAEFLTDLARSFSRTDRVHLGVPMLTKALTYKMSGSDEYYLLGQYIDQRYKQRAKDPTAIADVITACERTIDLIPTLRREWTAQYGRWDGFPPGHVGFGRLIAIRKKQKNHTEVARLEALYEEIWDRHSMDAIREARQAGSPSSNDRRWSSRDPYAVLGVTPSATVEDIRGAYVKLSKQYHPDRVASLGQEFKELAEARMKAINEAYSSLRGN